MMRLCLTLLFLALGGIPRRNCVCAKKLCDPGWVHYNKACYKNFNTLVTWLEAEATCLYHDSHLASIHSSKENDFVYELMGRPNDPFKRHGYWLGVHDSFVEGNYMNTDGSKATFLPFGKGQPDNAGGNENAIGSWIIEKRHITWNDYHGDSWQYPFVCKYYVGNRLCRRDEPSLKG